MTERSRHERLGPVQEHQ